MFCGCLKAVNIFVRLNNKFLNPSRWHQLGTALVIVIGNVTYLFRLWVETWAIKSPVGVGFWVVCCKKYVVKDFISRLYYPHCIFFFF